MTIRPAPVLFTVLLYLRGLIWALLEESNTFNKCMASETESRLRVMGQSSKVGLDTSATGVMSIPHERADLNMHFMLRYPREVSRN
jgi:hypothetical protein